MRCLLPFFLLALSAPADDALISRPEVKRALAFIEAAHERILASQVTIAEIPAPTFPSS